MTEENKSTNKKSTKRPRAVAFGVGGGGAGSATSPSAAASAAAAEQERDERARKRSRKSASGSSVSLIDQLDETQRVETTAIVQNSSEIARLQEALIRAKAKQEQQ